MKFKYFDGYVEILRNFFFLHSRDLPGVNFIEFYLINLKVSIISETIWSYAGARVPLGTAPAERHSSEEGFFNFEMEVDLSAFVYVRFSSWVLLICLLEFWGSYKGSALVFTSI